MSKVTKRKITVESPSSKLSNSNTSLNSSANKDTQRRQSVFERLGTKTGASLSVNTGQQLTAPENFCRHWNQNGSCPYGKSCVFVNTHTLISPSKRLPKKDLDPKQALGRSLGSEIDGLKRLHSTVVKRPSPELNWESWDQTDLEYEDEKALERRRQLLQRELELQMRQEETERRAPRHITSKQKKGVSSSSSTSVSSSTSDSSSSSDDSSSDSSSSASKRRRTKANKTKRKSASSVSDSDQKKIRNKSMRKDRSPSNMSRKSAGSRDKKGLSPPRKPASSLKVTARKKSPSPSHRRHGTPTNSNKSKPSTSKSSLVSRHNQSPRPSSGSKRSASLERKDKKKRSLSPRPRNKPLAKERSPRRSRRKDSPDRNSSRLRPPDSRADDRRKDDDRSKSKDDRRQDRKPGSERDKRDNEDVRAREKAREAAREKEREEALERCRERQREREQIAKDKDRSRDRPREDREKDSLKQKEYDKSIPSLMSLTAHNQPDRKLPDRDRDRDRPNKDRKDREKDKDKDKERDRDRLYDRNVDKSDRNRQLEKDRFSEKASDRDRVGEKEKTRERDVLNDRPREKADRDRSFDRDRNFDRNLVEAAERPFDREKDRANKVLDRSRERDFDREKDRSYDRVTDNRRSFEKAGERDRTSLEKDRGLVRDRGLERVLEMRERNKSSERGRISDGERSLDRSRDRFDREGRFDRRAITADDKGYESPFDSRRDRPRYGGGDGQERAGMFKEISPCREEARSMRHGQGFGEERRGRGGRDIRGWDARGYDDSGSAKPRDWDYSEARRDWDPRNRHGEWEGGMEAEEWSRYGGAGDWGPGGWRDEWSHRPPRHAPRDDQTVVPTNHIVVRDANTDDPSRRPQSTSDIIEKESSGIGDFKKDNSDIGCTGLESGGHKRAREENESVQESKKESKKPRLEDPPPAAILEEALSDISDDPDEILNREDIDVPALDCGEMVDGRTRANFTHPSAHELDQRLLEDRPGEEENLDNLGFEEISDEELEEEARANKGLGDALGVDWASLVAETRTRPVEAQPGAARRRWQPESILARIGVSQQYAGTDLFNQIQQKLTDTTDGNEKEDNDKSRLLHPVASLHMALRIRQARRRSLFSSVDTFKRALSARADLSIRRQLCNLPVASLEVQQSSGFCQWVV